MITLDQARGYTMFIGTLAGAGGCLACFGIYQTVPSMLGGLGLGVMMAAVTGSFMGMMIAARDGKTETTEQQEQGHDIPNLAPDGMYASETRGFVRPDQTLLEVAPGQTLVVSATRPQVDAVAKFIQLGKFNITYELTGKGLPFGRNEAFKKFRRELVERGLARNIGGQVVQLNERGRYGFLHPVTH